MNSNVKFHKRLPLGMVKGNKNRVWLKNGKELTIKTYKSGRFVRVSHFRRYKQVNVDRLYMELHEPQKLKTKTEKQDQVVFSKTDLKYQNRRGTYVSSMKARSPIISMSGYILRGEHRGKHLRDLPLNTIKWFVDTQNLNKNEMYEVDAELGRR
jgi:hypothetical protein